MRRIQFIKVETVDHAEERGDDGEVCTREAVDVGPVDDVPCTDKGRAHHSKEDDEDKQVEACLGECEPHDGEAPVERKEAEDVENPNHNGCNKHKKIRVNN